MTAELVDIFPLLPQRFDVTQEQILPARFCGALVQEERGEHRARPAPCQPARIANLFLDSIGELPREILRWRELELE